MYHPFQCLAYCSRPDAYAKDIVVAASGACIHTFNARDGNHISTWPPFQKDRTSSHVEFNQENDSNQLPSSSANVDSSERLRKRRRLSSTREESGSSAEILVESHDQEVESSKKRQTSNAPVIKVTCDSTGLYVVAVTGEDKNIRVFELLTDGVLSQFTERSMPKRPCAIAITQNNKEIICADKFGDVYSLPLLGQTIERGASRNRISETLTGSPSTTPLTVHTKGNREALRQQQKTNNPKTEKHFLHFDHRLILGHVSLLTDVICTSAASSHASRDYILTSDRDEHIRISRGSPQAHMIEGYCLGHTEFISKLRIFPSRPYLLLSGGGDDYLLLWNWHSRTIQQRIDLREHVESFKEQRCRSTIDKTQPIISEKASQTADCTEDKIAVANILIADIQTQARVIITCEGMPALFMFSLGTDEMLSFQRYIAVEGNVIDVVFIEHGKFILYSMDTVHAPSSTTTIDINHGQNARPPVGLLKSINLDWEKDSGSYKHLIESMQTCLGTLSDLQPKGTAKGRSLRDLLYNLESLRKRGSDE